jgi:predicted dehydrogenase
MANPIRVGLVGYGYWGPNYARVFNELPDAELAAICEVTPERRKRAATRHPRIPIFGEMQEFLRCPGIDGVVVTTPATTHFELAKTALESGRHVLVEKPLAVTLEHCLELRESAERTKRILMVAHTFLYNPGIRKMKECLA